MDQLIYDWIFSKVLIVLYPHPLFGEGQNLDTLMHLFDVVLNNAIRTYKLLHNKNGYIDISNVKIKI